MDIIVTRSTQLFKLGRPDAYAEVALEQLLLQRPALALADAHAPPARRNLFNLRGLQVLQLRNTA